MENIENGMIVGLDAALAEHYSSSPWADDRDQWLTLQYLDDRDLYADVMAWYLGVEGKYDADAMTEIMSELSEARQAELTEGFVEARHREDDFDKWYEER